MLYPLWSVKTRSKLTLISFKQVLTSVAWRKDGKLSLQAFLFLFSCLSFFLHSHLSCFTKYFICSLSKLCFISWCISTSPVLIVKVVLQVGLHPNKVIYFQSNVSNSSYMVDWRSISSIRLEISTLVNFIVHFQSRLLKLSLIVVLHPWSFQG